MLLRLLQTAETSCVKGFTKAHLVVCKFHGLSAVLRAATARCFAGKLGVQSDRVLNAVMNDRMVAKGLVLHWAPPSLWTSWPRSPWTTWWPSCARRAPGL